MAWVTYILECEGGHWYVGKTVDTHRRFRQHFTGRGARWLKLHPAKQLKEVWAGDREREFTIKLMRQYGVERVRGGPWCSTRSTPQVAELLLEEIMATQQVNNVNIKDWQFQPAQKNSYGGFFWPITANKDTKSCPRVQLGNDGVTLRCPFGVSSYGEGGTTGRSDLALSIPPWLQDLQMFLASVDRRVCDYVWENRTDFFPKKQPTSREALEDWYHPLLSSAREGFDPLLKCKISQNTPVFLCSEGVAPATKGTIADITPGSCVCPIVNFSRIWVMSGNRFGVSCVVSALLLWPRKEKTVSDLGFLLDAQSLVRSGCDAPVLETG